MSNSVDFLKSITDLNDADLKLRIREEEVRLKKLTFAHALTPLENPVSIRALRRNIARLKTVLKQKESEV